MSAQESSLVALPSATFSGPMPQGTQGPTLTPQTELAAAPVGNISFKIEIDENDVRARQFACHLTIRNGMINAIDLLAINYRHGADVILERSDVTNFLDLKREYDELRKDVRVLYRIAYTAYINTAASDFTNQVLQAIRAQFSSRNFFKTFYYVFAFRLYANQMAYVMRRMDFSIASAADAKAILEGLGRQGVALPNIELLESKISRLNQIEQTDSNFLKPEYVTQIQPGDELEIIYIIRGRRKLSAIASYTVGFDAKFGWDEPGTRRLQRTMSRSASFDVTPSPLTLSVFALVFAFLGAVLNSTPLLVGEPSEILPKLWTSQFLIKYFVAVVLSVVLFNSLEMTELNNKVRFISWRSAMFIGLLCGLLSDRMLKAITSFIGST